MIEHEADYITIEPAVSVSRFCVAVMRWRSGQQDYYLARCSQPLSRTAADALAKSWAAAMGLEIR